ncbi:hypothetical protein [Haliangium sp.]|uniref:hypothetical protein n=1 Tax=Haliangium sp. TaxID=2663208 RepID=UPI003D0BF996
MSIRSLLFAAITLTAALSAGCVAVDGGPDALQVDQSSQLLTVDEFRDYYCDPYHRGVYCGTEQTGRTVIKNRSQDIWIYVNSVSGSVTLELAEKVDGAWVTTHTEVAEPGFVERAYTFEDVKLRRARVIKARDDVYHVAVLSD